MTFYIHELGCSKNTTDVEQMTRVLVDAGHLPLSVPQGAELILIHTCGFIEAAVTEGIDAILEMVDYKEDKCKKIIVSGCLPQRYGKSLAEELPEVDLFLGTSYSHRIDEFIDAKTTGIKLGGLDFPLESFKRMEWKNSYAYVKIAEGCDNYCSYCIIPKLRGPQRSRSIDSIVKEVGQLASLGVKEIILIAQDVSRFGEDRGEIELLPLLRELNEIEGIEWIRLQYIYPDLLTAAFFEEMAKIEKVVPYLDMPIQHASNKILKAMNRHTSKEDLIEIVGAAREILPEVSLRTTVMIGFPGEGEEEFQELLDFVEEIGFDKLGAFVYSDEDMAASSKLPDKVPHEVASERFDQVMALQQRISEEKLSKKIGKVLDVLVDEVYDTSWIGRTKADSPEVDGIVYVSGTGVEVGDMVKVKITESSDYDLVGEYDESA